MAERHLGTVFCVGNLHTKKLSRNVGALLANLSQFEAAGLQVCLNLGEVKCEGTNQT